ncbi:MAG: L,D-transpeptidase [Alphaproteobacteria bacterium]
MDIVVTGDGWLQWGDTQVRCALGKGGLSLNKKEGDGTTPVGTFPLRRLLFREDRLERPKTRLPTLAIDEHDAWCDDPDYPLYNTKVATPYPARTEPLWREDHLYDLIVVLGHNDDPVVPGAGSAIFLHVAKPGYEPTEGCVALDIDDLLTLLAETSREDTLTVQKGTP